MLTTSRTFRCIVAGLAVSAAPASAQDTTVQRLPPVVTVTRDVGRSPLELPFSIVVTRPDSTRPGQPHVQLDQTLLVVPGVTASNRTNPSQDPRITIRGFGARSAFGVRSIRVLRDGMPLTLPDGQTPVDFLDLESVGSIEVIRGTASALYGNASGGVIDVRSSAPPLLPLAVGARAWAGADGLRRGVAMFGGTVGNTFYHANAGRTTGDGYREYSRQRLTNFFARAGTTVGRSELGLVLLGLDSPVGENPGALTRAQYDQDPRLADPASILRRARKEVQQVQAGLSVRTPLAGEGELAAQVHGGTRDLYNPLTFAVVDLDRTQYGGWARATIPWRGALGFHRLTAGADVQGQRDERLNYANCNGVTPPTASCPTPGTERGTLRLDQREDVTSVGGYARDELVLPYVTLIGGLRSDVVRFTLRDAFLTDGRDDSGERTLHAVSPMVGAIGKLARLHAIYANVSTAFETPTTTELGNQPDGSAGLNRELQPQRSTTLEAGVKGLAFTRVYYDVALFRTAVRDELVPFEVPGGSGRTYYRNAGRTRREGGELHAGIQWDRADVAASYTYSNFRFRDFVVEGNQYEGNRIPGVPEHQFQVAATGRAAGGFATVELQTRSSVPANDANSVSVDGFAVVNARMGWTAAFGRPWFSPVVGVQNLFGTKYVGSVAINATGATLADAKFYEPAAGRSFFVGLQVGTGR